ncbi:pyrokinin-1 receptor-like, partial [Physella acuta]|uniref:pyrokinin-1 receptor-like n=1 Tax=Physella acuta TaxID=109671 RepID=UPI0027DB7F02
MMDIEHLYLPKVTNTSGLSLNWSGQDNMTYQSYDVGKVLLELFGAKRKEMLSVVVLMIVYSIIFLTGVIGNVCTCIVIARNAYMRTVTNYYLFSLAVSDVLTLLFALPPELYSIWEAYPWHFGEPFCIFKAFIIETTSYTSVLTITSFTVERYIAICHPIRGQRSSRQSRAIKCIITIWTLAALCALPYPIHTRVFTFVHDPRDQQPIGDSVVCNIPSQWQQRMYYVFQISTFVFFVIPMAVITGMYLLIGMRLRSSSLSSTFSIQTQQSKSAVSRARRAVLKML